MQQSNVTVVRAGQSDRAVVFVHGFTGGRDDTWDRFPFLLGTTTQTWDIFTVGYATTLMPDLVGVWSADPDLPILATLLCTQLNIAPLRRYRSVALIAHSMGGLIVQKALVDDQNLAAKIEHVILFGTPSGGLRKARWLPFWKRQLKNMAQGSTFITELRNDWKRLYSAGSSFRCLVVAGASDQFVPPDSSLEPFDRSVRRVVVGDHISIVKPADTNAPSLNLVLGALEGAELQAPDLRAQLRLAGESATKDAPRLVKDLETSAGAMSVKEIVDAALALDRAGARAESISLLERHKNLNTDVKGTLGGRIKRLWFDTEKPEYAERALRLYEEALYAATAPDQIYYLAINVAFLKFVYENDAEGARQMANLALRHAEPPGDDVWKTATVAEAYLYLDRIPEALAQYRRLLSLQAEEWKHRSASLQAGRIAAKLQDRHLAEELEELFTPGAKRVNRIFVSYSHVDRDWLEKLKRKIAPYLREAEAELDLWDDSRVSAGGLWEQEVKEALGRAGVAVALVSPAYCSSDYVMSRELPAILNAAQRGGLKLLRVDVSGTGLGRTELDKFQSANGVRGPLDSLPASEQEELLESMARQMKEAALSATDRFKNVAAHERTS